MITVLNFYVDPYRLFASPIVPGYNAKKPALSSHVRITKPYQVLRDQPHTLLIGNSRVEMGIDPQLVCWKPAERPVYNMGIPGSSVYMQVRYAQHALDNAPIKLILYGVDFTDFLNFDGTQPAPSYWPEPNQRFEKRLADTPADVPTPGYAWQSIKDHAAALFTLDALRDSITTLAGQRPATTTRTADGFNPSAPYYRGIVHTEGEYVLFEQKNRALDRRYAGQTWQLYAPGRHWSDEFEAVKRLKLEAQRKGAQLILFINPYHIQYLLMLYRAHLWPLFAQ